jgi:tryptophan-rich sensory protein
MNFTREDVNALFSLVPLVLWQIYTPNRRKTQQYEKESKNVRGAPRGYVFGIVWSVIYALIITSGFIYFRLFETSQYYLAASVLFLVNILLNKFWSVAFWNVNTNGKKYALVIIIVLIITGVAFLCLMGQEKAWLSFGLYVPYVLWLLYATYLNYASIRRREESPPKLEKTKGYYSSPSRPLVRKGNIPRISTNGQWRKK